MSSQAIARRAAGRLGVAVRRALASSRGAAANAALRGRMP
jgi:hypothetical protein